MHLAVLTTGVQANAHALPDQAVTPHDIPGAIAIDLVDDLSQRDIEVFGTEMGLVLHASSVLTARTRIHTVEVSPEQVDAWLRKLRDDRRVQHVEPIAKVFALGDSGEVVSGLSLPMDRVGARRAWRYSTGRGVTVAVIDTGVDCESRSPFSTCVDLSHTACRTGFNVVDSTPNTLDDNGHGTYVAATIAQSTNQGWSAFGMAFHARLLPVKALNSRGWGTTLTVADGIRYAADAGADVINLSLGGQRASRIMFDSIEYARSKRATVVAAANDNDEFIMYPAGFDGVVAVTATDNIDKLAEFSSRGGHVDLAAPDMPHTHQTACGNTDECCQRVARVSGSSVAAAQVSAAAALLMSVGVIDPLHVHALLLSSARPQAMDSDKGQPSAIGILDAGQAVHTAVSTQVVARFLLVFLFTAVVLLCVHRKGGLRHPWRAGYWFAALAFGPGLFAAAPWVTSRAYLLVDLLARPIPEWDLLIGVSVHRWLPLAHCVVPFSLSAGAFRFRRARPYIAGVAIGIASYLASIPLLELTASDLRARAMQTAWALLNVMGCVWLAFLQLDERETV